MEEKKQEIIESTTFLFEYFFKKMTGWQKYKFSPSDNQKKQIESFIKLLHKKYSLFSVGPDFLIDYFTFQFNYWSQLDTRFDNKVMFNWVVGKKAIERWDDKHKSWSYFLTDFIKDKGIDREVLFNKIAKKTDISLMETSEVERRRFYNTDRGLLHCIETTPLYNSRSKLCILCKHKNDCKQLINN